MTNKIDPIFRLEVRDRYLQLHAERPRSASAYLREIAETHGWNYKTLHRHLDLDVRKPRKTSLATELKRAEIDSFTRFIFKEMQAFSFDDNAMSLKNAFTSLQSAGRIPSHLTLAQVYESSGRQCLREDAMPVAKRFERQSPMSMWQMDFTKSRYLKHESKDDGVTIRDPRFTKRQDDGRSLFIGIAVDDASRVSFVKYFIAKGEDAHTVQNFLLGAFEDKPGDVLKGMPSQIFVDRGSGWIDSRTKSGLVKLGVQEILGGDEYDASGRRLKRSNKKARGKVERMVRVVKENMEAEFYMRLGTGAKLSIAELNLMASKWIAAHNHKHHPTRTGATRWEIYEPAVASLKFPPDDAIAYFSRQTVATVIKRKIRVAPGVYCIAPNFTGEGEIVEIVKDQMGHYLFHEGKRVKLQYEAGAPEDFKQAERERAIEHKSEQKSDTLSGRDLNVRFDRELQAKLQTTINRLSDDIREDMRPFFAEPHTIAEIEEQVQWIRLRLEAKRPSNIIQLPVNYAHRDSHI